MIQHRVTFSRRPAALMPPEVIGAADFDSLDAAGAAGQRWVEEDPILHRYEIELRTAPDGPASRSLQLPD
jgi:hypothetical protein